MTDPFSYLTETRGIDSAIAEYAAWRSKGREYVIPYFDAQGRERAVRYHNPTGKPKYRSESGSKGHLYCVENVRFAKVVLCEGEIDTLSALSAGYMAVGVAGATSFFKPWVHLLDHVDELVLAFDGDAAGREAAGKIKGLLPQASIVEMPADTDLNDVLLTDGVRGVRELLG